MAGARRLSLCKLSFTTPDVTGLLLCSGADAWLADGDGGWESVFGWDVCSVVVFCCTS